VAAAEKEQGVSGYRNTQDEMENVAAKKADLDEQKGKTLEDMSGMVGQLTMKIGERKARLAPIIKELRPLRQQCQNMEVLCCTLNIIIKT
jgi:intraflagellar transport protein 81